MPYLYKEKELSIRSLLGQNLVRGKMDFSINIDQSSVESAPEINQKLASHYYEQIKTLSTKLNIEDNGEPLSILMRMPEIFTSSTEELNDDEWTDILNGIKETIGKVDSYRMHEGSQLQGELTNRIDNIQGLLIEVEPYEEARVPRIKERINNNLNSFIADVSKDNDRLEQEMIYYLEKLDITEEKIRLAKHCEYFIKTIESEKNAGKKLGFICQEIGREINTMGSKANDVDIQRIVVLMKDELEKIKEQLFNIL